MTDQSQPDDKGLIPDELVEQLVTDPGQPPDVVALVGLLGSGPQPGTWRLYLTIALDRYVDFGDDDVIQSRKIETSSIGGTVVWLRRGTALRLTSVHQADEQAGFLRGDVTNTFLSSATPSGFGGGPVGAAPVTAGTWSNTRCDFCSFMCCQTW